MTAYTPYQPEVSQGTLQTIFEYESMVGELFDLDVVSASHYDGASATAEAALMMLRATKSRRVLISEGVHPHVRRVVATYFQDRFVLDEVPIADDGSTDLVALRRTLADAEPAGGLIMAQPNFFGILEPMAQAADVVHEAGGLFTAVAEPVSLALLAPPGEVGADIAAADGQPLGIPLQYGGPSVGLLACTRTLARQIPGRLIGRAKDADGRSCYVMTLRAREQDIRRERAASNICTNQALCALATTVYLATLGPAGLRSVAEQGAARAHDLEDSLREIGIHRVHAGPYLNEFAVWVPNARRVHEEMLDRGYLAGLPLSDCFPERRDELLLCATELTTLEEIEGFTRTLATVVGA